MTQRVQVDGLRIAAPLYDVIVRHIAPGTGVAPDRFWTALENMVAGMGGRNRALLAKRTELHAAVDVRHREWRDEAGVHRQAQATRAGRGGLYRGIVPHGRGCPGRVPQHLEHRHHGRGAAHHGEPEGMHPRGVGTDHLLQRRLSGPHRRRDPHLRRVRSGAAGARTAFGLHQPIPHARRREARARGNEGRT